MTSLCSILPGFPPRHGVSKHVASSLQNPYSHLADPLLFCCIPPDLPNMLFPQDRLPQQPSPTTAPWCISTIFPLVGPKWSEIPKVSPYPKGTPHPQPVGCSSASQSSGTTTSLTKHLQECSPQRGFQKSSLFTQYMHKSG